jgi:hypothetical protein
MDDIQIIWDLPVDPQGNYQHITQKHLVTVDEVEEVLTLHHCATTSRSTGYPITFGWTSSSKYLAVVYVAVADEPLSFYPLTAYPTKPPRK